ncbi:MAG: gamma-glutamyltransferase, partial [Saprospiraceae bacterium]|nr:gamma-glutamyltransferase [Saprospiraceae bacterium]
MNTLKIYLLSIVLLLGACKSSYQPLSIPITKDVKTSKAMVITAHPFASQVGLDVLKKGGNAVDAAIAVQFALAVCYPAAGNIGGGGFMVYRDKNGNVKCLDFREKAPMAATTNMYLDADGNVIADLSTTGHLAVGVPGVVDGMWQAFEQYSKLKDWKSLVQPAIDGASYGVILTEREAKGLNAEAKTFDLVNKRKTAFTTNPNWKVGDLFIQKELAGTLKSIRDKGRAGFYEGKVAKTLVKEMQKGNGLITLNDLMDYKAVWRTPITFTYKGYEIVSMPPPSSGGIALMQLMKMIEPYDIQSMGLHSTNSIHLIVEAERRVYADRAAHLGDSDFYPVP